MKTFALFICLAAIIAITPATSDAKPPARQYYEIRIYHYTTPEQEQLLDSYLKDALIPALHRLSIKEVGVFKDISNETDTSKELYILIPYTSLSQPGTIMDKLEKDKAYRTAGAAYIDAPFDRAPYKRMEKILTWAFPGMPVMEPTKLNGPRAERVYELRSYESATEKLHLKKVKMFNEGDEIGLFKKLGFNAVFYSQALTGAALPNLVYMITFDNMASHDKLWDAFRNAPEWKKLSALDEYKNAMYKADSFLLRPTDYSDY